MPDGTTFFTLKQRTHAGGVMCAGGEFILNRRNWRGSFWMPPRVIVDPDNLDALPHVVKRAGAVVYMAPGGKEVCE